MNESTRSHLLHRPLRVRAPLQIHLQHHPLRRHAFPQDPRLLPDIAIRWVQRSR